MCALQGPVRCCHPVCESVFRQTGHEGCVSNARFVVFPPDDQLCLPSCSQFCILLHHRSALCNYWKTGLRSRP